MHFDGSPHKCRLAINDWLRHCKLELLVHLVIVRRYRWRLCVTRPMLRRTTLTYVGIVFIEKLSELVYKVIQKYFSGSPGFFQNFFCQGSTESHLGEYNRRPPRVFVGKGK